MLGEKKNLGSLEPKEFPEDQNNQEWLKYILS